MEQSYGSWKDRINTPILVQPCRNILSIEHRWTVLIWAQQSSDRRVLLRVEACQLSALSLSFSQQQVVIKSQHDSYILDMILLFHH